jgi:catechol 2,3-dioxygenase-like lactoylglutathione lyase family enzyme
MSILSSPDRQSAPTPGNMSHQVVGLDHVEITVLDMEIACAFYERLFGAKTVFQYAPDDKVLVRQIAIGTTVLSIHQAGNGLDLIAKRPTIGGADFCWRWAGNIASALALLTEHGIEVIDGPSPRRTADGLLSDSVYFRDPDGNLLELMAAR